MDEIKLLSLIVPTYKQENTIIQNVRSLNIVLGKLQVPYEIILVIDGDFDKNKVKLK